MPTDLFFSQPVSPNPPAGIQSGGQGPSGLSQTSKNQTPPKSSAGDKENFLATLEAASRNGTPKKPRPADGQAPSSETTASIEFGEMDEKTDPAVTPVDMANPIETDSEPFQTPSNWNSEGFINLLEGLGLTDLIADADLQQLTDENASVTNQLAALEMLIERMQQIQSELPDGRQAELSQLQQILSDIRDGQFPPVIDDSFRQGLSTYQLMTPDPISGRLPEHRSAFSPKQLAELEQINQWIRSLASGLQERKAVSDLAIGQGAADGKVPAAMPAEAGNVVLSVESSAGLSHLSKPSSSESLNSSSDVRPSVTVIHQESLVKNGLEAESTGNSKAKELPGSWPGRPVTPQADVGNQAAPAHEPSNTHEKAKNSQFQKSNPLSSDIKIDSQSQKPNPESGVITSDRQSQHQEPASGKVPTIANFTEYRVQGPSSDEPLSRVFQETQLVKEGVAKVESVAFEDNSSKVVKLDAATNENSLLNSSGQNTEKLAETFALKKEAEAGQGDLRTQTMDQLVRKAAIHLRNGQHEARIELKPDFLGHVRMQVISEHQQVTVRILAEHGFVKEMIEGNVHQLKADLQQQGLEIDKLEVSVSRDSEDSANNKDKLAQSKFRQVSENRHNGDHSQEEPPEKPRRSILDEDKSSAVDFFA